MAQGKTKTTSTSAPPPPNGFIQASEVSHHLDILIGTRHAAAKPPDPKKKGKTLFDETIQKWTKQFAEAKQWMRRKMIPSITEELMTAGCRFLKVAEEKTPAGKCQYIRSYNTRQIHAKLGRALNQAVKAYVASEEGKAAMEELAVKKERSISVPPAAIPVEQQSREAPDAPDAPIAVTDTRKTPIQLIMPRDKPAAPSLPRDKPTTAAPFLTRNASMMSILSGTHSVDCLIGSMMNDGVFGELPKAVDTYVSMNDSKTFSVEEHADAFALGMSHPQELLERTSSMSFAEWARNMPMSPPAVKSVCDNMEVGALAVNAGGFQPPMMVSNRATSGGDMPCVSPSFSSTNTPASDSVSEMSHHMGSHVPDQDLVEVPRAWLLRLSRLEETVIALLHDNIDLRQKFTTHQTLASTIADEPMVEDTESVGTQVDWSTND